jgi:hypothetical protein
MRRFVLKLMEKLRSQLDPGVSVSSQGSAWVSMRASDLQETSSSFTYDVGAAARGPITKTTSDFTWRLITHYPDSDSGIQASGSESI